jgi:hypothetical protein
MLFLAACTDHIGYNLYYGGKPILSWHKLGRCKMPVLEEQV